jgi:hypothetical protein
MFCVNGSSGWRCREFGRPLGGAPRLSGRAVGLTPLSAATDTRGSSGRCSCPSGRRLRVCRGRSRTCRRSAGSVSARLNAASPIPGNRRRGDRTSSTASPWASVGSSRAASDCHSRRSLHRFVPGDERTPSLQRVTDLCQIDAIVVEGLLASVVLGVVHARGVRRVQRER